MLQAWLKIFKSVWKSHRTQFRPIIENLRRHKRLVESHASLIEFEAVQLLKTKAEEEFAYLRKAEDRKQRSAVLDWLNAAIVEEDLEAKSKARFEYPGVCTWILLENKFKLWKDFSSNANHFLWIIGRPGAGECAPVARSPYLVKEWSNNFYRKIHLGFFHHRDTSSNPFYPDSILLLQERA
jgi:hypothetical protein